jgi:hypothetical protein
VAMAALSLCRVNWIKARPFVSACLLCEHLI